MAWILVQINIQKRGIVYSTRGNPEMIALHELRCLHSWNDWPKICKVRKLNIGELNQ